MILTDLKFLLIDDLEVVLMIKPQCSLIFNPNKKPHPFLVV